RRRARRSVRTPAQRPSGTASARVRGCATPAARSPGTSARSSGSRCRSAPTGCAGGGGCTAPRPESLDQSRVLDLLAPPLLAGLGQGVDRVVVRVALAQHLVVDVLDGRAVVLGPVRDAVFAVVL